MKTAPARARLWLKSIWTSDGYYNMDRAASGLVLGLEKPLHRTTYKPYFLLTDIASFLIFNFHLKMIKSTEKYVSLKLYQFLSRCVYNIRENFLVKCQIGKSLEDLLQGRLVSRILRNLMFLFQFLGKLEEETNWLVLPIH